MFQNWRFKLREADEALREGRLEETSRVLSDGGLTEFLPGRRLAARLVSAFVARARQFAESGELDSGWADLQSARSFSGDTEDLANLRRFLVRAGLSQVEEKLCHGDTAGALSQIEKLEKRKAASGELQTLREVAKRMESARHLCRRGRFADADGQLTSALTLRADIEELQKRRDACREMQQKSHELTEQLHRAMAESRWSDAAASADELLVLAPESALARDARRKAWAAVGANVIDSGRAGLTEVWTPSRRANRARPEDAVSNEPAGPRFLLWVDGVGGYLVCLSDQVVFGQATTTSNIDVPILADVSRRHAKIRREGESYVIEPLHMTRINGHAVQSKTILRDGEEIELGNGVRFRFRRPHALSGSARLEFVSRHRTQPYADGVLLMAESCVLGPRRHNHVVCRDWSGDVVLYRQDDDLYCRAMESIEIDGQLCDGRGRLEGNSRVVGDDFSMSLEELDRCSTLPLL